MIKKSSLLGLFTLCVLTLAGCGITPPDVQIQDYELMEGEWYWRVEGTAKNVGGDADLCHVVIKFYDKDDVLLGTGGDTIFDLDAGETWHFSGGLFDSGTPDHAKVEVDEIR